MRWAPAWFTIGVLLSSDPKVWKFSPIVAARMPNITSSTAISFACIEPVIKFKLMWIVPYLLSRLGS
jgi:hypothetical protein